MLPVPRILCPTPHAPCPTPRALPNPTRPARPPYRYGLVLNEIGMEPIFDSLQARVLQPIARLLFPHEGCSLDRHHSFIVQYEMGKDLGLDMHTDNSDVTFNVCCGRDFEGAGLTFCGSMGEGSHRKFSYRHKHVKGHAVVHLGRRRHGADDLTTGERLNLIVWNTNLVFRNSAGYMDLQRQHRYEREVGPPDEVCLSYTHDRDYFTYKEKPSAHAKMTRRAWCPPKFAQHDAPATPSPASGAEGVRRGAAGGTLELSPSSSDDLRMKLASAGAEFAEERSETEATIDDARELQRVLNELVGPAKGPTGGAGGGGGGGVPGPGSAVPTQREVPQGDEVFTPQDELERLLEPGLG